MSRLGSRRLGGTSLLAACAVLLAAFLAAPALAQRAEYRVLPVADALQSRAALSALNSVKNQVLTGRASLAENRDKFEQYYKGYYFPLLTQWETQDLAELRGDLFNDFRRSDDQAAVHAELVELVRNACASLARNDFHPATRYNAMLILGELNAREAEGASVPPEPLPEALPIMIEELQNPDQIDAVRVAALIGIRRHILTHIARGSNDLDGTPSQRISQATLALLASERPPQRSPNGHAWLERQAIEILALLGSAGENGEVFQAFVRAMTDPAEPLFLRCAAAQALSQLSYPEELPFDVFELNRQIGILAVDCCQNELARIDQWESQNPMPEEEDTGGRRPTRPGARSRASDLEIYEAAAQRQAQNMRRRLKEQLASVSTANTAIANLPQDADSRDLNSQVSSSIARMQKALDSRNSDDEFELDTVAGGVANAMYDLVDLVRAPQEEPAPEADFDDSDPLEAGPEAASDPAEELDPEFEAAPPEFEASEAPAELDPAEEFPAP